MQGISATFTANMTANFWTPYVSAGTEQTISISASSEVEKSQTRTQIDEYEAPPKSDLRIYQRTTILKTAEGITSFIYDEPEIIVNPPSNLINL